MENLSKSTNGFSLVELMVVIAIIAILAAAATPMYLNYKKKTIMTEAIYVSGGVKAQIEDYISDSKDPSNNIHNILTGISVINTSTSGATIEINMNERDPIAFTDSDDTLRLVGVVVSGAVFEWTCLHNSNASDIAVKNTPRTCLGTFSA